MKKALATICLFGSTMALAACGTTDHSSASYAKNQTAHYGNEASATPVAPAEQVFHRAQMK